MKSKLKVGLIESGIDYLVDCLFIDLCILNLYLLGDYIRDYKK